jgi:hypothetical protein
VSNPRGGRGTRWPLAGYAACGWGLLFAAVSFYWAAGGTAGADTVGGSMEKLGRAHDPGIVAALLLTLYGGILVAVEALVATHVIRPSGTVDWKALLWHPYLWDMSFLLWGLLFTVAAWHYTRRESPAGPAPAR